MKRILGIVLLFALLATYTHALFGCDAFPSAEMLQQVEQANNLSNDVRYAPFLKEWRPSGYTRVSQLSQSLKNEYVGDWPYEELMPRTNLEYYCSIYEVAKHQLGYLHGPFEVYVTGEPTTIVRPGTWYKDGEKTECIIELFTTDPQYRFWGINVGTYLQPAINGLTEAGFELDTDTSETDGRIYIACRKKEDGAIWKNLKMFYGNITKEEALAEYAERYPEICASDDYVIEVVPDYQICFKNGLVTVYLRYNFENEVTHIRVTVPNFGEDERIGVGEMGRE